MSVKLGAQNDSKHQHIFLRETESQQLNKQLLKCLKKMNIAGILVNSSVGDIGCLLN